MESAGSSILHPVPPTENTGVNFGFYSLLREEAAPNSRSLLFKLCAPREARRQRPHTLRHGVTGHRFSIPLLETLQGSPLIKPH